MLFLLRNLLQDSTLKKIRLLKIFGNYWDY